MNNKNEAKSSDTQKTDMELQSQVKINAISTRIPDNKIYVTI